MPFTVSHAAAVLPLRRTRLVWSAMVIGTFGPDFQYFLGMTYNSRSWHNYPDILRYCLPFTAVAFVLFQLFVKRSIGGVLPAALQQRIDLETSLVPKTLASAGVTLLSLVTGIATHIAWDAFTHRGTIPWRHIELLRNPTFVPKLYGSELAQQLSTTIGLIVLFVCAVRWYRRTSPSYQVISRMTGKAKLAVWAELLVLATAGALWRATWLTGPPWIRGGYPYFWLIALISAIGWLLWGTLAYGIVITIAHLRAQKKAEAHR